MRCIFNFVFGLFLLCPLFVQADTVIWTENFDSDSYTAGVNPDGNATATGSGSIATSVSDSGSGSVSINAGGGVTLTAGTDPVSFTMRSTAAVPVGFFQFDASFASNDGVPDVVFLQMIDEHSASDSDPAPYFSDDFDASEFGLSGTVKTVRYYFNTTANAISYAAPDSTTKSLAAGTYSVFIDNALKFDNQTSSNDSAGVPTSGVDSLVFSNFGGQDAAAFSFDNMSLTQLTAVPEPSSLLVGGLLGGFALLRRRRV